MREEKDHEREQSDNSQVSDNEDTLAYRKENIKETEHDRDLKTKDKIKSEFGDLSKMMKNVVTKLMQQIKKPKQGESPRDESMY